MRKRVIVLLQLLTVAATTFADGPPHEFGPTDPHRITPIGLNQRILVIYAQANDYRIPAGQLAAMNAAEDPKRTDFANWFPDTSWNRLTMQVTPLRTGGSNWYSFPVGCWSTCVPAACGQCRSAIPAGSGESDSRSSRSRMPPARAGAARRKYLRSSAR